MQNSSIYYLIEQHLKWTCCHFWKYLEVIYCSATWWSF